MRGEKTVTFDFNFEYSHDGNFVEANTITLRAPGLGKFDVHNTMQAYVSKAVVSFAAQLRDANKGQPDQSTDDEDVSDTSEPDDDKDVMVIMAMGLDLDVYPKFAAYVQRVLTNTPKLATIGDTKVPITDAVWSSIEERGGIEAANKIMSEFTSFFFDALGSKKASGKGKPLSSASPSKGPSPSNTPKTSRSKN